MAATAEKAANGSLLQVRNLHKRIPIRRGVFSRKVGEFKVLNGINFTLNEGDIMGCVGESGSGKTVLLQSILGLSSPTSGEVLFQGKSLVELKGTELKQLRRQLGVIFQDPVGSLHPRMTVETILTEPMAIHGVGTAEERTARAKELLRLVGLDASMAGRYPHQFSGGQRQRIGIARALALHPKMILADEPVSALDVSLAAQVLNLFLDLQEQLNLTYFIVAHDMAVLRQLCTKVGVIYAGQFVERGLSAEIYGSAQHPYTHMLLAASPSMRKSLESETMVVVPRGESPSPGNLPNGCPLHPRCDFADEVCRAEPPPEKHLSATHTVLCHVFPQ